MFLMIAMNTFFLAKNNSDDVVTAAELKTIADRIASRVVEAGFIGQEFQNATLNLTVNVPQDLNGHPFYVEARSYGIYANTTDLPLSALATTFNLKAVTGFEIDGKVQSSNQRLVVTYSIQDNGARRSIHLHEGS